MPSPEPDATQQQPDSPIHGETPADQPVDSGAGSPSRRLIDAQISRNRLLTGVIAVAALFNAAFLALIFASIAGSTVAGVLLIALIAVFCIAVWAMFEHIAPRQTAARPISDAPSEQRLFHIVTALAPRFGLAPAPHVLVMDQPVPNAFTVGSGPRATVVYSTRLLELLDDDELAAVSAHELSHIANHDSRVAVFSTSLLLWAKLMLGLAVVAAVLIWNLGIGFMKSTRDDADDAVGGILRFIFGLGFFITAALVFVFGQMWFLVTKLAELGIGRQREWMADATAASVTNKPLALASALNKLDQENTALARGGKLVQHLCLVGEPRHGHWWDDLLQTHPSTPRRIQRLRDFAFTEDRLSGSGGSSTGMAEGGNPPPISLPDVHAADDPNVEPSNGCGSPEPNSGGKNPGVTISSPALQCRPEKRSKAAIVATAMLGIVVLSIALIPSFIDAVQNDEALPQVSGGDVPYESSSTPTSKYRFVPDTPSTASVVQGPEDVAVVPVSPNPSRPLTTITQSPQQAPSPGTQEPVSPTQPTLSTTAPSPPGSKPTYIYPKDGDTLDYDGPYVIRVTPVPGASGYLYGFFQDDHQPVWENYSNEGSLSGTEYGIYTGSVGHSRFHVGAVEVWVRAYVNNNWTDAAIITFYLN